MKCYSTGVSSSKGKDVSFEFVSMTAKRRTCFESPVVHSKREKYGSDMAKFQFFKRPGEASDAQGVVAVLYSKFISVSVIYNGSHTTKTLNAKISKE